MLLCPNLLKQERRICRRPHVERCHHTAAAGVKHAEHGIVPFGEVHTLFLLLLLRLRLPLLLLSKQVELLVVVVPLVSSLVRALAWNHRGEVLELAVVLRAPAAIVDTGL